MSRPYIPVEFQEQVLADAGHRCGSCHSDERLSGIPLSIEHSIPQVADGPTARENLWRSCRPCNEQKGGQTAAATLRQASSCRSTTRAHSPGASMLAGASIVP